jgi:hypothetical protein
MAFATDKTRRRREKKRREIEKGPTTNTTKKGMQRDGEGVVRD